MVYQIPDRAPNLLWLAAMAAMSCGPGTTRHAKAPRAEPAPVASTDTADSSLPKRAAVADQLTVAEARSYMLDLVNRDRATEGLPPVTLDRGPAGAAGQEHADDMAARGFLGHWGSDGSMPEHRHTVAGGVDVVTENAACVVDEKARTLDGEPTIARSEVERTESMFFNEKPPNDGHRKNILGRFHTSVGIGIAQAKPLKGELPLPCFSQEFIDHYGTYDPIPAKTKVGRVLHVSGTLSGGMRPTGVGLARVETPKPLAVAELNKRRSHSIPAPYQMYWGKGFVTPKEVAISGDHFAIDVPLDDHGKPGLYEVSIWGKLHGKGEHKIVGLRTVLVTR